MIKGILWDNDGVLVNTEHLFYEANREIFAAHGIDLSTQNFVAWFLEGNRGAWHLLQEKGYSDQQIVVLRNARNRCYATRLERAENLTRSGIASMLARLHGRVRMGVVTASFEEHFYLAHGKLKLLRYFDFVLAKNQHIRPKPSPDSYLLGLQKLGIEADSCIAVEDSPRGLTAATAAGIKCIVLRSDLLADYPFANAYRVVSTTDELLNELELLLA